MSLRVAVVGFAHMHVNGLVDAFAAEPEVEWVGCADVPPDVPELSEARYTRAWNRAHVLQTVARLREFEDWRRMLEAARPDLAIVCCENQHDAAVVETCAALGVGACVEKPMAASLADGLRMARAARLAGTLLVVNWPVAWAPVMRTARRLVSSGAIGRVLQVKYRGGHAGPFGAGVSHPGVSEAATPLSEKELASTWWYRRAAGGGAMVDYCCYGAMLGRWLLGERALAAVGTRGNLASDFADIDDTAVLTARYPTAIGVFEGSWTTWHHGVPPGPLMYGTEGTIVVDGKKKSIILYRGRGAEPHEVQPDDLPAGRTTIAQELLHHRNTDAPLFDVLTPETNLDALATLDAGLRSAVSGREEPVRSPAWQIGE